MPDETPAVEEAPVASASTKTPNSSPFVECDVCHRSIIVADGFCRHCGYKPEA